MRLLDCIKICSTCQNQGFDSEGGVICSKTQKRPAFDDQCPLYVVATEDTINRNKNSQHSTPNEESSLSTKAEGWIIGFATFTLIFGILGTTIYAVTLFYETKDVSGCIFFCTTGIFGTIFCWAILRVFANISLRLQSISNKLDKLNK